MVRSPKVKKIVVTTAERNLRFTGGDNLQVMMTCNRAGVFRTTMSSSPRWKGRRKQHVPQNVTKY
jgi:hypothetical protein